VRIIKAFQNNLSEQLINIIRTFDKIDIFQRKQQNKHTRYDTLVENTALLNYKAID